MPGLEALLVRAKGEGDALVQDAVLVAGVCARPRPVPASWPQGPGMLVKTLSLKHFTV